MKVSSNFQKWDGKVISELDHGRIHCGQFSPKTKSIIRRRKRKGTTPSPFTYIITLLISQLHTTCHSLSVISYTIDQDAICLIELYA